VSRVGASDARTSSTFGARINTLSSFILSSFVHKKNPRLELRN
jgi:hypothetical protein